MDNFFIYDPVHDTPGDRKFRLAARVLKRFGVKGELVAEPDPTRQMITIEQRINLWHLAEQVLAYAVPGEFVDLGCFDGRTSALLATLLNRQGRERGLHLYDSFEHRLGFDVDPKASLLGHFEARALPRPALHVGRFETTLPRELPERIAFAQLDCGVGGAPEYHAALIRHCLEALWPRLSPGAVCVIQDYHDPASGIRAHNFYPFIKPVVDEFLRPWGAQAVALFAGRYSHGFFRKPLAATPGPANPPPR